MTAAQNEAGGSRHRPRRGDGWQAEKSAITRYAILDAAVDCLVERGYNRTTTAMIAESAGVSRGAMMHHFPSRIAVIRAVVEHVHGRRLAEYRELMEGIDKPEGCVTRERIRKLVESAWRYVNLPSFIAYQELMTAARTDSELKDVLERVEKDVEVLFQQTLKQVFPHWEQPGVLEIANDMVQFTMRGMASSYLASRRQKRARQMIEQVADQLEALCLQGRAER